MVRSLWRDRPLAVRLILAMTGILILAVAGVTVLSIYREQLNFQSELHQQALALLNALAAAAADPLYFLDTNKLADIAMRLGEVEPVRSVCFYSRNGRLLADSRSPQGVRNLTVDPFGQGLLDSTGIVFEWAPDRLLAGMPVWAGNQKMGGVSVELSTAVLNGKLVRVRNQGILAALLAAGAGVFLALLISRSITIPLQVLLKATRRIARGDLSTRIDIRGRDELGLLSEAFNQMTGQLEQTLVRKSAIVETALDCIITINARGGIIEFNPAAERTFGYRRSQAIGGELAELLFSPPFREELRSLIAGYPDSDQGTVIGKRISVTARRAGGQEFSLEMAITPVRLEETLLFTVIARDITERRRAEQKTAASLREKEILLKEIHHRVKNNLQLISSLLGLQSNYVPDQKTAAVLKETRNRVRTMGVIHDVLYRAEDLSKIPVSKYIRNLASQVFQSYGIKRERIGLSVRVEDVTLDLDSGVLCSLIINELVSNSLKHAFPDGRSGKVRIDLRSRDDGLRLRVSDNGVGIPQGFDPQSGGSLGMRLVTALTEQMEGTLKVQSNGGTVFEIFFRGTTDR